MNFDCTMRNSKGHVLPLSLFIKDDESRFDLLLHVCSANIDQVFVLGLAMRCEPSLSAGKELVEFSRRHGIGKISVPSNGDDPAQRLTLFDRDALLIGRKFQHAVPGITGGVPVGVDQRRDRPPGRTRFGTSVMYSNSLGSVLRNRYVLILT